MTRKAKAANRLAEEAFSLYVRLSAEFMHQFDIEVVNYPHYSERLTRLSRLKRLAERRYLRRREAIA